LTVEPKRTKNSKGREMRQGESAFIKPRSPPLTEKGATAPRGERCTGFPREKEHRRGVERKNNVCRTGETKDFLSAFTPPQLWANQ